MSRRSVLAILAVGLWLASPAGAFTLLHFPSETDVELGGYKTWQDPGTGFVDLSYALGGVGDASGFFDGGLSRAEAVANAFATWQAGARRVRFPDAGHAPVVNSFDNFAALPPNGDWQGPPGTGLGAHIDVIAAPEDFTFYDVYYRQRGFSETSLGFTNVTTISGSIVSVDIYLNTRWDWETDGTDFDIETFVLHEIGHAIGLDHPDQAAANGAANYDPNNFEPGRPVAGNEVMWSTYQGVKRELTADEIGGAAFLYPYLKGDTNFDGDVDLHDISAVKWAYGTCEGDPSYNPLYDFNNNGVVNLWDISFVKNAYTGAIQTGGIIPEPATAALLGVGSLLLILRRRR